MKSSSRLSRELRQQVVGVDPGAGDDLQTRRGGQPLQSGDVAAEQHRGRIDDRPDSVLFDRLGGFECEPILVIVITHVGPLRRDRLVTGEEMLVDQREAEILGIDRSGHRLFRTHGGSSLSCFCQRDPMSAGAVAVVSRRRRRGQAARSARRMPSPVSCGSVRDVGSSNPDACSRC
jgi:hypothetical protein